MWLALKAFLVCLILTPIFRDIFRSYGIVDKPDRRRKVHVYPIPRVGGIPIAIAYRGRALPFLDRVATPDGVPAAGLEDDPGRGTDLRRRPDRRPDRFEAVAKVTRATGEPRGWLIGRACAWLGSPGSFRTTSG